MLSIAGRRVTGMPTLTMKVFVVPLALVLMLASFAILSSAMAERSLLEEISVTTVGVASLVSAGIDRGLYQKYHELHVFAAGFVMRSSLSESNSAYDAMADPDAYIDGVDAEWSSTPLDTTTPLMQAIMANDLSRNLSERLDLHYESAHGVDIYCEILVTNKYGAIAAMTARSTDFRQDDEAWWQNARDEGGFISDIEFDESSAMYGAAVCIAVTGYDGAFAGVMKAVVDIVGIVYESGSLESSFETTETKVLTADGYQVFSSRAFLVMDDLSGTDFFLQATGESGTFVGVEGGRERLFSYYRSTGYLTYEGHGWIVLVSHDSEEILQPVSDLQTNFMVATVVLVGLGLAGSIAFARSVSVPVRRLAAAASRLSEGDLGARTGIRRDDEIGELARAFDHMAEELGELYDGLEHKVRERTEELEKANRKLNILGSITRHDALNQMSVLRGWLGLARETVTNEVTDEYLDKVTVASENVASYLRFTGEYEKIGVKSPEWQSLSESFVSSTYGLNLGGIEVVDKTASAEVYADPMFPKVLRNLVVNSLKHGRSVTRVSIASEETADGLLVVYEDDGVGIPEDLKDSLFVSAKGHGLYLSSEILAITDITIQEVGEPGKGVRFEIRVPKQHYRLVEH